MAPLIAEELLLVAYSPDGTAHGKGAELDCALGGSLLVELVLDGHAELDGTRIRACAGHQPPANPELVGALAEVATKPRRPQAWVSRLSKGARRRLLTDLVEAGVLSDERYRWGPFTRHRFPLIDPRLREDALRRLRAVVLDGQHPHPRTAALASMISAAGLDRRVFPDSDRKVVKRRLWEIADGDWAAEAVRRAVQEVHAGTVAAVMVTSSAGDGGSGGGD